MIIPQHIYSNKFKKNIKQKATNLKLIAFIKNDLKVYLADKMFFTTEPSLVVNLTKYNVPL